VLRGDEDRGGGVMIRRGVVPPVSHLSGQQG